MKTFQEFQEKAGIFKSTVLNKKYSNQPKMTEKGKDISVSYTHLTLPTKA